MDNIKDIIKNVIGQMGENKLSRHEKIDRIWLNVLNELELKHTKLVGLKNGWLSVYVDSPAWLYQMKIKKNKILERIQEEIPDVININFKIGKIN